MTGNFSATQLRTFDVSRSILSIRSERSSTGFNASVMAYLKQSSSSFLKLLIASFAARKRGVEYKRNRQVVHALPCEDPESKLNRIFNYFLVYDILLIVPKQFLSFSKTIN